jgi:hypothetical protein
MTKTTHYKIEHWTTATAIANYKNEPPVVITVNDRAATRQAIITRVHQSGVEFVERSHWAAHKAKPASMENDWNYNQIAIHMAGRSYTCGPAALQVKEIQEEHQNDRKWADIAYHYAISCAGDVYEARDIRFKGAHLDGFNSGVIGIVLLENLSEPEESSDGIGVIQSILKALGGYRSITVPDAQKTGLKTLIKVLQEFFNIKGLGGHREFPKQNSKAARLCPGAHGISLVKELRSWSSLAKPAE